MAKMEANAMGANAMGANTMGANTMGANVITIAPKDIRNTLSNDTKNQAGLKRTDVAYKNKRVEAFVTIATQSKMCDCDCNCCWCYSRESIDARCCGACYFICPKKTVEAQCNCCQNDFSTYWDSGLVQTVSGYGNKTEEKNGVCCWLCFPLKFGLFFPCFLGALGNGCINCLRETNLNYLF
jgi:hypothetical protein